jgi:hypothetical protein
MNIIIKLLMLIIIANPSMSKAENYCPNKASFKKYFDMSASLGIVDVCQKNIISQSQMKKHCL